MQIKDAKWVKRLTIWGRKERNTEILPEILSEEDHFEYLSTGGKVLQVIQEQDVRLWSGVSLFRREIVVGYF
jgi:hypothetical protein